MGVGWAAHSAGRSYARMWGKAVNTPGPTWSEIFQAAEEMDRTAAQSRLDLIANEVAELARAEVLRGEHNPVAAAFILRQRSHKARSAERSQVLRFNADRIISGQPFRATVRSSGAIDIRLLDGEPQPTKELAAYLTLPDLQLTHGAYVLDKKGFVAARNRLMMEMMAIESRGWPVAPSLRMNLDGPQTDLAQRLAKVDQSMAELQNAVGIEYEIRVAGTVQARGYVIPDLSGKEFETPHAFYMRTRTEVWYAMHAEIAA